MFEITGDDIAALNDEDLRSLIGRLCEAELRRRNISTSFVTWGGNQTAKDGGLDVHVELPAGTIIDGFIPKSITGFQVKMSNMPPTAISNEMRPGKAKVLREAIQDLINASGAYVIVSSNGSTSHTALKDRKNAMMDALKGVRNAKNLTLDFYDRNRIATWVRDHVGLIPWVRSKVGLSINGWRPFESWSYTPEGADKSYLIDDEARIKSGSQDEGDGLSTVDGINKIRNILRKPGQMVRLVGLSGVGKTRFVEALFEDTVGTDALDPSLAIYTNVAELPDPQPAGLASDLIATRSNAILVIDNCPPEIHRQLSDIVRRSNSTISIITIEYDIREDQPEGTDVFTLDTSSLPLIEKLITRRFTYISEINAGRIAEFSGGNARIAIALSERLEKDESISELTDLELFKRLFNQRQIHDPSLLKIAQACSLAYSFDGETLSGDNSELPLLAAIAGKSVDEVYIGIAELRRRDLLQKRSLWRAVLPHAIANRLAVLALQDFPTHKLTNYLVNKAPERLLLSFSRRLGYLDKNETAQEIVKSWLKPGGLLENLTNYNETQKKVLINVAPVLPGEVLSLLENTLSVADETELRKNAYLVRLIRSIAFDPTHFKRAISLLIKFSKLHELKNWQQDDAKNVFESMFHIYLSGTHAKLEMRLEIVNNLLHSKDVDDQSLGLKALQATFKTGGFSSHYDFDFGARSRDYGYIPKTRKDSRNWFYTALKFAEQLALDDSPISKSVQKIIAQQFRGLWTQIGLADDLESIALAINEKGFWRDGWIAARRTRIYDSQHFPSDIQARIIAIEKKLGPKDLVNQVRGVILSLNGGSLEFDELDEVVNDDFAGAADRATLTVINLGRLVASNENAFRVLLPELMTGQGKLFFFGQGLAYGSKDPANTWKALVAEFVATSSHSTALLEGFIAGLHNSNIDLKEKLLDDAQKDTVLSKWLPSLHSGININKKGLARLNTALRLNAAPITQFNNISGRITDDISGSDFRKFVLTISKKSDGYDIALNLLFMRILSDKANKRPLSPELADAGKQLLRAYDFSSKNYGNSRDDYNISVIAKASFADAESKPIVSQMCKKLKYSLSRYEAHSYDYHELFKTLFQLHPIEVLDALFTGDKKEQCQSVQFVRELENFGKSPIIEASEKIIFNWCNSNPEVRFPIAAAILRIYYCPNSESPEVWSEITYQLLRDAPDPVKVFNEIIFRLYPHSYNGSLATTLETRLLLLDSLDISDLPALNEPYGKARNNFKTDIIAERSRETSEDKAKSGKFEW